MDHIQHSIEYWLNYLQQWNIIPASSTTSNNNHTSLSPLWSDQVAIIVVGTQKDKLSQRIQQQQQQEYRNRLRSLETLFNQYQSDARINDWIIVSGQNIAGIDQLINKIH